MSKAHTLAKTARHLGCGKSTVVNFLATKGMVHDECTLDEIRLAYITKLRDAASGRGASEGGLDLMAERARLAKVQADKVELQNAIARNEYAHVSVLTLALSKVGSQVAGILEAIPVKLKRRSSISYDDLQFIKGEIVKARNLAAKVNLTDAEVAEMESRIDDA
ncbi:MAG: terminase small subunit [Candidatus Nitrotoga sp.]